MSDYSDGCFEMNRAELERGFLVNDSRKKEKKISAVTVDL